MSFASMERARLCEAGNSRRRCRGPYGTVGLLLIIIAAGVPAAARAQEQGPSHEYWGLGVGPVFAWGTAGFSTGWEVSGTLRYPLAHFSIGGDYPRRDSTRGDTYYVAWEPGVFIGASIGASATQTVADDDKEWTPNAAHPMLGAWGGAAFPLKVEAEPYGVGFYTWSGVWLSLALGYRYLGGEHQFYMARVPPNPGLPFDHVA